MRCFAMLLPLALISATSAAPPAGSPPAMPVKPVPAQRPEMVLQLGQNGSGFSVEFTPDGRGLLTADGDALRHWDTHSHDLIHLWRSTQNGAMTATFTPDGKLIASIGGVGEKSTTLVFHNPITGKRVRTLDCPGQFEEFVFSPDGRRLAVVGVGRKVVDLLDAANGKRLRSLARLKGMLCGLSFSRDGRRLCIGDDRGYNEEPHTYKSTTARGEVRLVDTGTNRVIRTIPKMNAGALSPDGRLLFTAGQTLRLWDTKSWQVLKQVRPQEEDRGFDFPSFSPDGRFIVTGGGAEDGGTVMVREVPSLRVVRTWYVYWPHSIAFSRQSDKIAISAGHLHSELTLASLRTGKVLWQSTWADDPLNGIALHPDGRTLAAGNGWYTPAGGGSPTQGHVAFWDLSSGRLTLRFAAGNDRTGLSWSCVSQVRFSADGKVMGIATGQGSQGYSLWRYPALTPIRSWDGEVVWQERMALSSDATALISGMDTQRDDGTRRPDTRIWDTRSGKRGRTLKNVRFLAAAPDAHSFLAGTGTKQLQVRDTTSGKVLHTLSTAVTATVAGYSPAGDRVAIGHSDGSVTLWDTRNYRLLRTLTGAHLGEVSSLGFSPDGHWLASAALTIKVWNLETGRVSATLRGAAGGIVELAFARDGAQITAAAGDRAVYVWDRSTGQMRATLRELPAPDIDEPSQEWIAYTPDGYYTGSPRAERFIRWRAGGKLLPASAYTHTYRSPEKVAAALGGPR